jgi:hypothetical protein
MQILHLFDGNKSIAETWFNIANCIKEIENSKAILKRNINSPGMALIQEEGKENYQEIKEEEHLEINTGNTSRPKTAILEIPKEILINGVKGPSLPLAKILDDSNLYLT